MVKKRVLFLVLAFGIFLASMSFISAWVFNGTIRDVNGTALNNSIINVTVRNQSFIVMSYNSTTSNATGWFNLTLTDNSNWFYEPSITHFQSNSTSTTPIDFVGQNVPAFPYQELQNGLTVNFYLREAGTINITAVNATGTATTFFYVIKDQSLGFPIATNFQTYVSQATIYVPRDRNYSIMIFPNQSMPVSYDFNNFTATSSYNISTPGTTNNISNYNVSNRSLNKVFNVTENLVWVNGYTFNSTGSRMTWNEFSVVPFLIESSNSPMVFLGQGGMPYNMSAWRSGDNETDNFSIGTGIYNMTLPGPAESANYILFATARNGTDYYGGYRNITLNYTDTGVQVNFTMYPLMSTDWNSSNSNISMNNAANWSQTTNISSAKKAFNLVSSAGTILNQTSAHIEITVDYTNYNATQFTFMMDPAQEGNATFYLPLINATGIKEINIYSMNYAPKRVGTKTALQILANNNITLNTFNPGDIDSQIQASNIVMELYTSNSTCDVPSPSSACRLGGSGDSFDEFNPLGAVIGGGKISFRMGTGSILIHYVNVDMMASGPPDALFDDSATENTTGDFDSALRFGSLGPTIYDYVLVSMPYTEGSSSVSGLNESAQVNISIPFFYDENSSGVIDWETPIWNTTANGTNGSLLANNYTHFSTYSSDWQTLMGNNTCGTNVSIFNATNPCYLDTTNNRVWIRLPHFSGTKPSITGTAIAATTSSSSSSGGGGGGGSASINKSQGFAKITPGAAAIIKNFNATMGVKEIQIQVKNVAQNVKITVSKYDGKPSAVSVEKTGKVYKYLEIKAENLTDNIEKAIIKIQVEKIWLSENNLSKEDIALFKFNSQTNAWNELQTTYNGTEGNYEIYSVEVTSFSYFSIAEKTVEQTPTQEGTTTQTQEQKNLTWLWILIVVVAVALIIWVSHRLYQDVKFKKLASKVKVKSFTPRK